jgi:hypothetical protein
MFAIIGHCFPPPMRVRAAEAASSGLNPAVGHIRGSCLIQPGEIVTSPNPVSGPLTAAPTRMATVKTLCDHLRSTPSLPRAVFLSRLSAVYHGETGLRASKDLFGWLLGVCCLVH